MHLILLGPAGSGKGTLARMLVERDGYRLFETGAELRRLAEEPTEAGRTLRAELARGNMAPTAMVMEALARTLCDASGARFILDGIPRNPEQTEAFLARMSAGEIRVGSVILLDGERELLRQRLLSRRGCNACGSIYNLGGSGPFPVAGRCRCGGTLVQRQDDHEDGIERRFALYDTLTAPALAMLEAAGLPVRRIDGGGHPEATYAALGRPVTRERRRLALGR